MKGIIALCACCMALYACGSPQESRTIDPNEWEPPVPSEPTRTPFASSEEDDEPAPENEEQQVRRGPNPFVPTSAEPVLDGEGAASMRAAEREVLYWVNQARATGGQCGNRNYPPARPLIYDDSLAHAALSHSRDMAQNRFFSHTGFTGSLPMDRVIAAGFDGASQVGENVAAGLTDPQAVVDYWLESASHCANIRSPIFARMGVGFVVDADSQHGAYWTQVFAGTI